MYNPYIPKLARIMGVVEEAYGVKTFKLEVNGELKFSPGQFVMVSAFGVGEAPFAIASSPSKTSEIEVSIRAVGNVTRYLHRMKVGEIVGVRGPLGKGFPLEQFKDRNIMVVAGGTGLFGVSSLIWHIYENREEYGEVHLLYGVRKPSFILRRADIEEWDKKIGVHITVDIPEPGWSGHVGLVTTLLDKIGIPKENIVFAVCGPPLMMKAVYLKLLKLGYKPNQIYVSLERNMKCGIGKCGRCMLSNGLYVCKDGPVFRCDKLPERDIE